MAVFFFVFTAGKVGESGEIITHTHTRPLRLFAIFIGCQMADTCQISFPPNCNNLQILIQFANQTDTGKVKPIKIDAVLVWL